MTLRFTIHKDSVECEPEVATTRSLGLALDFLECLGNGMYQILDNEDGDVLTVICWSGELYQVGEKGISEEYIIEWMGSNQREGGE